MARQIPAVVESTTVIISGCGPTGAVLSALLDQYQVPNVILEREPEITTDPRGIALDEDGIRILQAVGVYDRIFTEIGSCLLRFNFISGSGSDLMKPPMISVDNTTSEGGTAHVGFLVHKQPILERAVRDRLASSKWSDLRTSSTINGIHEDENQVIVTYLDAGGETRQLSGLFLVGADGKTGYVRKNFLEPKGVLMEQVGGVSYEATWVALNWHISLPTRTTHPDFPLWQLGYTSQQVYDLFFPKHFRFLCNPSRPAVCGRFGLPEDRLWRFEFVVHPGEDGDRMASFPETSKIIHPYITHDGKRYGLRESVQFPLDCIQTLRSRPFHFSARSCNRWADGRVILVGDAAHVFPPFGGQGIASGFRDALALAWRLALLHQDRTRICHQRLLTTWYTERKQQFDRSLAMTTENGEFVTESNPWKILWRDWYLWAVQLVPSWRRDLEKGPRIAGMTRYRAGSGLPFISELGGGIQMPQVYIYDLHLKKVRFSDDLIFSESKKGFFQLLLIPRTEQEMNALIEICNAVRTLTLPMLIDLDEMTVVLQDLAFSARDDGKRFGNGKISMSRIASAEEFAESELCIGRPPPIYYDPFRMLKDVNRKPILVLRPDRFVFAACSDATELDGAISQLESKLYFQPLSTKL